MQKTSIFGVVVLNPSLRGFLRYLKLRIVMAMKGNGIICKTKLIIWVLLDSVPRTIMRKLSFLRKYVEYSKNRLTEGLMVTISGNKFRCTDSESIWIILSPESENWMWNHLSIRKGYVFVDIGAHIGKYSIPIAKIVGDNGLVIAVEPCPENYMTLKENIKLNGLKNVIALKMAAWNKKCKIKLFIGDKGGLHSLKKDFGLGYIVVQADALDNVFDQFGVKNINYVKIDVEGAELEVLKGLERTLQMLKPNIVIEIKDENISEVNEFLKELGYFSVQIAPNYYKLSPMPIY